MYKKISRLTDLEVLQEGDLVICYPLAGEPCTHADLSDPGNFLIYEYLSTHKDLVQLQLMEETQDNQGQPQKNLRKSPGDFIKEDIWWISP